jgi:hypothetical protein
MLRRGGRVRLARCRSYGEELGRSYGEGASQLGRSCSGVLKRADGDGVSVVQRRNEKFL